MLKSWCRTYRLKVILFAVRKLLFAYTCIVVFRLCSVKTVKKMIWSLKKYAFLYPQIATRFFTAGGVSRSFGGCERDTYGARPVTIQ